MSSSNLAEKRDETSLTKKALDVVLSAVEEVRRKLGICISLYLYPHPAVGGKVVFYYWDQGTYRFLLHTRSREMTVNPGRVDAAGGYFNEDKDDNPVDSTKREVREEHGKAFYDALPSDFIAADSVADTKFGFEPNPFYLKLGLDAKEAYCTLVWYVKIPQDVADLAIAGDHEVEEVVHISLADVHRCYHAGDIVPDIYATIMTGLDNGKIS